MPDFSELDKILTSVAALLGVVGVGSLVRRRLSKDSVGVTVDRAEGGYLSKAIENMTSSRDAWQKSAMELGEQLGKCREERRGLEVQNDHLREQAVQCHLVVRDMKLQADSLYRKLARAYPAAAALLSSDFGKPDLEPRVSTGPADDVSEK